MQAYVGEFVGTALLIMLGNGVVANVCLNKSNMRGAGPIMITLGWGLALLLPVFIFGNVSGAHVNPAVTLALAADGSFPWNEVPGYMVAQFLGAFVGSVLVYVLYKSQFDDTSDDACAIKACFCTAPAVRNLPLNLLSEIVGTFVLVFAIKGIGQVTGIAAGLAPVFVFCILVSIGMSMGGLTGYAVNPARDLGPRIAHAVLPIKGKGDSDWAYGLIVPIVGPVIGGMVAVGLYAVIFSV